MGTLSARYPAPQRWHISTTLLLVEHGTLARCTGGAEQRVRYCTACNRFEDWLVVQKALWVWKWGKKTCSSDSEMVQEGDWMARRKQIKCASSTTATWSVILTLFNIRFWKAVLPYRNLKCTTACWYMLTSLLLPIVVKLSSMECSYKLEVLPWKNCTNLSASHQVIWDLCYQAYNMPTANLKTHSTSKVLLFTSKSLRTCKTTIACAYLKNVLLEYEWNGLILSNVLYINKL